MYEFITPSRPASIIVDDSPSRFPIGATAFWKDLNGHWHTVEIIDCTPRGFGFACVRWYEFGWGYRTASVPFAALVDLDTYVELQGDFAQFEAATVEDDFDYPDTGEDAAYDDYHDRQAIVRMGYGA